MSAKVPILMYHRIASDQSDPRYTIAPIRFEEHMRFLAEAGYRVVSLDTVLLGLAGRVALPGNAVALTFDDGYEETCDHACPILKRLGLSATFFLVTGLMRQSAKWVGAIPHPGARLLDWDMCRALCADGFTVGAHSVTHRALDELDTPSAREEIAASKGALEERLGVSIRFFAYPYGRFDGRIRVLVLEAGYDAACSTRSGFNTEETDPYALRRLDVAGRDSVGILARKLAFGANEVGPGRLLRYYGRRAGMRLLKWEA